MKDRAHNQGKTRARSPEVQEYWVYRRRTAWSLVAIVAGGVLLAVFNTPKAWGNRDIASFIYYAAWFDIVVFTLLAHVWNAEMAERRGYCLGKFGKTPQELTPGRARASAGEDDA